MEELENQFTQRWGEKRDHGYSLTEFNAIKRKPDENISYFVEIFNKLYNSFPAEMKPPPFGAKVFFVGALKKILVSHFEKGYPPTLEQI